MSALSIRYYSILLAQDCADVPWHRTVSLYPDADKIRDIYHTGQYFYHVNVCMKFRIDTNEYRGKNIIEVAIASFKDVATQSNDGVSKLIKILLWKSFASMLGKASQRSQGQLLLIFHTDDGNKNFG